MTNTKHDEVQENYEPFFSDVDDDNKETKVSNKRRPVYQCIWEQQYILKYIALILIIPPVLNYAALKQERLALLPEKGELVDMGWGQKMFIKCVGEGLPTVILEAPTGQSSDIWYLIQEKLSKVSKVCVYDRAGLGFSDLPFLNGMNQMQQEGNRKFVSHLATLEQMTSDLHHLVTEAKPLTRPFMIVGSEIGGLIARHYSMMYPEDVSSIVLINPLVEDLFWRQKEEWHEFWNFQMIPTLQSFQLSAYIGISRIAVLTGHLKADIAGGPIPKEIEYIQLSHWCNPSHMSAVLHEHLLLNTSFYQMSEVWNTKPFSKNISVTVINSKKYEKFPPEFQKAWHQSQLYLRETLHPSCKHFVSSGSAIQHFREPGTIVKQVKELIIQWRMVYDIFPTVHTFQEQKSYIK